jgi:hypothetical protein
MKNLKRLFAVAVTFFVVFVCLLSSALAEDWKSMAEVAVGIHSKYLNEASGALSYDKTMSNQSVMVGMDKNGTGLYIKAENFAPLEKEENRETDFYLGGYTEIAGAKVDVGYARYWVRKSEALDYNAIYASVDFPEVGWKIVPFVKAEYDFAGKSHETELSEKISASMDGFMYRGGLKREFQLHERVSLLAEVSIGGNTGIYGLPAENLAFAREKVEVSISLAERWKLKVSALTQQNLGKRDGIAADTDRLFVSAAVVWTF